VGRERKEKKKNRPFLLHRLPALPSLPRLATKEGRERGEKKRSRRTIPGVVHEGQTSPLESNAGRERKEEKRGEEKKKKPACSNSHFFPSVFSIRAGSTKPNGEGKREGGKKKRVTLERRSSSVASATT